VYRVRSEDRYLRQAEEARRWAEETKSEKARAAWLRIAAQWLSLIPGYVAGSASDAVSGEQNRSGAGTKSDRS